MGNCEKSAYYERAKALEAKEKDSSCFHSAKAEPHHHSPVPTNQEPRREPLDNAPQMQLQPTPPQKITTILEQNRKTSDQGSSYKESGGHKNECKLISNYGNPCDHAQCAEVMNASALLNPSNKKIPQASVVLREFEDQVEGR